MTYIVKKKVAFAVGCGLFISEDSVRVEYPRKRFQYRGGQDCPPGCLGRLKAIKKCQKNKKG